MLLVLVSFTGQTLSIVNLCDHMMSHNNSSMNHSKVDHSTAHHSDMNHTLMSQTEHDHSMMSHADINHDQQTHDLQNNDCCITDCVCPTSTCSTISLIETNHTVTFDNKAQNDQYALPQQVPTLTNSYLYRPPIFS